MKTHPRHFQAAWLLILFLGAGSAGPLRAEDEIEKAFRDALYAEEVKGDSEAALKAYQEVGAKFETQRDMAATALFRQGECLRKLGRKEEAGAAYQKVLALYGDRERVAKLSRENLAALGLPAPGNPAAPSPAGAPPDAAAAVDEDAMEISRLMNLSKNSPDLLTEGELKNAASRESPAVTAWLLEHLPKPLPAGELGKALTIASSEGRLKICELLLDAGTNPDGQAEWRPFWAAVESKRLAVMKLLLERKADVNVRRDIAGGQDTMGIPVGFTENLQMELSGTALQPGPCTLKAASPVMAAVMGREMHEVLDLLLNTGADPNAMADLIGPITSSTGSDGRKRTEVPPPFSLSPLGAAILRNNPDTVRRLLAVKADANKAFGYSSSPPLLFALMLYPGNPDEKEARGKLDKIVQTLLDGGADWKGTLSNGAGALHICARLNLTAWLERGIKAGLDVNARDKAGNTALHHAVRASSAAAVRILLGAGTKADPEAGSSPVRPLIIACSKGPDSQSLEIAKMLLDAGADPNGSKDAGFGPLNAIMGGRSWFYGGFSTEAMNLLIDRGARPGDSEILSGKSWERNSQGVPAFSSGLLDTFRKAWKAACERDNPGLKRAVWLSQSESMVRCSRVPVFAAVLNDAAPVSRPPTLREFLAMAPRAIDGTDPRSRLVTDWEHLEIIRGAGGRGGEAPNKDAAASPGSSVVSLNAKQFFEDPGKNDVALQWGDIVELPVRLETAEVGSAARKDIERRMFSETPIELRLQPAKDRVVTNAPQGSGNLFHAVANRVSSSSLSANEGDVLRAAGVPVMLFDGLEIIRTASSGGVSSVPGSKESNESAQDPFAERESSGVKPGSGIKHGDTVQMRSPLTVGKLSDDQLLTCVWLCQSADGPFWKVPPQWTLDNKAAPLAGLVVALLGPHPLPSACFAWDKATVRWYGAPPPEKNAASSKKEKETPPPASVWNEKKLLEVWPSLRMEPGMLITLPPAEADSFEPPGKLRAALTAALTADWKLITMTESGQRLEMKCHYEPRFFKGAKKDGIWIWRDMDGGRAGNPLLPIAIDLLEAQPRSRGKAPESVLHGQLYITFPDGNGVQAQDLSQWLTVPGSVVDVK